jgi:2-haloalkanoic acid dehalogenase type II
MDMINTVIFDVYGTLLDTRGCSLVVLQEVTKKNMSPETIYVKWREKIEEMISSMDSEDKFVVEKEFFRTAMDRAFKDCGIDANAHERMNLYNEMCWGKRTVYPDTQKAIKELRKHCKVVIASNSDTEPLIKDLKRNGIAVDEVITSEMLKLYKPHKRFYGKVLAKIGKKAEECTHIGDNLENDCNIPKSIGMKTIWVNRRKKEPSSEPDFTVADLSEIDDIIKNKINR